MIELRLREYESRETLPNRRSVLLRAIRPDDKQSLVDGLKRLSAESIYRRFFSVKTRLSEAELSYLTEVDFRTHVALVAVVREDGANVPVGVGRFIVIDSCPSAAEVAFTVDDGHQGLGIGTRQSGSPTAAAWSSSRSSRTACMATLPATSLMMVTKPTSSRAGSCRIRCSDQALSFPLLQDSSALRRAMDGDDSTP